MDLETENMLAREKRLRKEGSNRLAPSSASCEHVFAAKPRRLESS